MCTPIGHALSGAAAGLWASPTPLMGRTKDLAFFALLSQAPDLDFIPGILVGMHDAYHHGPSHSLGFAVLAGLAGLAWGLMRGKAWRWALAAFLVYAMHVGLDAFTMDTSLPYGAPLLWPFSGEYFISPTPIFLDVWRKPLGWPLLWHNLMAVGLEIVILGPVALVSWWMTRKPLRREIL